MREIHPREPMEIHPRESMDVSKAGSDTLEQPGIAGDDGKKKSWKDPWEEGLESAPIFRRKGLKIGMSCQAFCHFSRERQESWKAVGGKQLRSFSTWRRGGRERFPGCDPCPSGKIPPEKMRKKNPQQNWEKGEKSLGSGRNARLGFGGK